MDIFLIIAVFMGLAILVFIIRRLSHSGAKGYERIVAWGSRRVGPLHKDMDQVEIHNYVSKMESTSSKPFSSKTVEGLKKHIHKTHGKK